MPESDSPFHIVIPEGFEPMELKLLRRIDQDYPDLDFDASADGDASGTLLS